MENGGGMTKLIRIWGHKVYGYNGQGVIVRDFIGNGL
jgi:hypothetical protein